METIVILSVLCLVLCLWINRLLNKLAEAYEFNTMAVKTIVDLADGKVQVIRTSGGIKIQKVIPKTVGTTWMGANK